MIIPFSFMIKSSADTSSFISEWQTTAVDELVTIPLSTSYTYDITVNWDDGSGTTVFNAVGDATSLNHTYSVAGTYNIVITPNSANGWKGIRFNNSGDKDKIYDILQWGDSAIEVLNFYGCSNLTGGTAMDVPNLTALTSMSAAFRGATSLNVTNFGNWQPYSVTDFQNCFRDATLSLTPDISNWVTSVCTRVDFMLIFQNAWNYDLSNWDISNLTDGNLFMNNNFAWTTANYDLTLIAWAAQAPSIQTGVIFTAIKQKFTQGIVDSGTADGTTANKLIDSTQDFITTVTIGDIIYNSTDTTYARVTAIDSDIQLSLDVDIMASTEAYVVQTAAAAKAHYVLEGDYSWDIQDAQGL